MGDSGGNDWKYRLSDGRDARHIVAEVEAMAEREAARTARLATLVWKDLLPPFRTGEFADASFALFNSLPTRADVSRLVDTAIEKWTAEPPHQPVERLLEYWYSMGSGDTDSLGDRRTPDLLDEALRVLGIRTSTLSNGQAIGDAAEKFLSYAEGLVGRGVAEPREAIRRSGDAELAGLRPEERRRVVEKALELEEQRLEPGTVERETAERGHFWRKAFAVRHLSGERGR